MPKTLKTLLSVLVFGSFIALIWLAKTPLEIYREKPMPDYLVTSLEGEALSTASWRKGKPYIINFFASWCGPCRAEMSELHILSQFIPVYGVAMQDSPANVQKMLAKTGNPFTVVALDSTGAMSRGLEVYSLPTTVLMDGLGQVSYVKQGQIAKGEAATTWRSLIEHQF